MLHHHTARWALLAIRAATSTFQHAIRDEEQVLLLRSVLSWRANRQEESNPTRDFRLDHNKELKSWGYCELI